jgi:hypothetical protein
MERPHFGQANRMVMARDLLGMRSAGIKMNNSPSMETDRRRIKFGG